MVDTTQERFWSKVDTSGDCWEWTAGRNNSGYGSFYYTNTPGNAHRYSYILHRGTVPDGMRVDHLCHNKICVNPQHLRLATHKQNLENRSGPQGNSKSGVRGVSWDEHAKKWQAQARHNNRTIPGGKFSNLEDAKQAALQLRNELFTHNDLDRAA
jgi:hypothetical protein